MSNSCFGRDSGNSPFVPIVPPPECFEPTCDLCSVMGKELACEDLPGTARVVWCTHWEMDSEVFVSVVGDTGPWISVASSAIEVQCHDFQFPILVIGKQWFYVESTSEKCGTLTSNVGVICTGDTILIKTPGLFEISSLYTLKNKVDHISLISSPGTATPAYDNGIIQPMGTVIINHALRDLVVHRDILDDTLGMATPTHSFI